MISAEGGREGEELFGLGGGVGGLEGGGGRGEVGFRGAVEIKGGGRREEEETLR